MFEPTGRLAPRESSAGGETSWQDIFFDQVSCERGRVSHWSTPGTQHCSLGWVDPHIMKQMAGANVIPVSVRLQDDWLPVGERANQGGEVADAQAGVEHRHSLAALDQVRLDVFVVVRLSNHCDAVTEVLDLEPIGFAHANHPPAAMRTVIASRRERQTGSPVTITV